MEERSRVVWRSARTKIKFKLGRDVFEVVVEEIFLAILESEYKR